MKEAGKIVSLFCVLSFCGVCICLPITAPKLKLNDGRYIPALALGTWLGTDKDGKRVPTTGNEVAPSVEWAIDAGYRHIDTAHIYGIEDQVGRALKNKIDNGTVTRDQIFVTTKLWNDKHERNQVVPALRNSLKNLGLDYVDLYLIHWPVGYTTDGKISNVDYLDTWKGMEDAQKLGLAKSIGVSNFNAEQLQRVLDNCETKPAVLQIEVNLNLAQKDLVTLAQTNGIVVMAYTPFGSLFGPRAPNAPDLRVDDPSLVTIAERHRKTVPQVVLRYLIQRGLLPIPKSLRKEKIEQNIDVFDFQLSEEETRTLDSFDRDYRVICLPITAPKLKLNDGRYIPALALGTWLGTDKDGKRVPTTGNEVAPSVEWAIDAGYRHIDTAHIYGIEDQVGRALKNKIDNGTVTRDQIFVTTKLWNDKHERNQVVPALRNSLKNLGLDYVDLYLIHWPVGYTTDGKISNVDYLDTWKGMEDAQKLGLAKSIGVSNFNAEQLQRVLDNCETKPAVLQIEVNLNLAQKDLVTLAQTNGIVVMAYTPFGSLFGPRAPNAPELRVDDPSLVTIAERHRKTVPQVVLRYLIQRGLLPIPKSLRKEKIEQNIDVFDFQLTDEETRTLDSLDQNYRVVHQKKWEDHPYYPFHKAPVKTS